MREYAVSVFVICAIVGILSRMLHGGRADFSRSAIAAVSAFVILSPIASLVSEFSIEKYFPDDEYFTYGESEYEDVAKDAVESAVRSAVAERFSISEECVRVVLEGFSFSEMKADKIKVYLSFGAMSVNPDDVVRYVNEFEIGECYAEFEI